MPGSIRACASNEPAPSPLPAEEMARPRPHADGAARRARRALARGARSAPHRFCAEPQAARRWRPRAGHRPPRPRSPRPRAALFIGGCTVVLTALVGGALGLVAGFVERWPSTVLMRIADVQLSFPFILLAMTINAIVGLGLRNIVLSLSAAGWVVYARVVRGEVLSVKQRDYVHAAAALGMSRTR